MKLPSDAQARLLSRIEGLDRDDHEVLWDPMASARSRAAIFYETVDRELDRGGLTYLFLRRTEQPLVSTIGVLLREGWLDGRHERVFVSGLPIIGVQHIGHREQEPRTLNELALTEDGRIALGVWRERRMAASPSLPELDDRQREIVQLAQRALDLGYALCAREPARDEARRMRKDGWWDGCWVANSATGLVPTSLAIAAALPERADQPMPPVDQFPSRFDAIDKAEGKS